MAAYADNNTMAATANDNLVMATTHNLSTATAVATGVNATVEAPSMGGSSGCRKTQGRRKIELTKIKNQNSLEVTFCKRRQNVIKKASELSTLCGSEIGLLIISPTGKPYTFGYSSFEAIMDSYLAGEEHGAVEEHNHNVEEKEHVLAELAEELSKKQALLDNEIVKGVGLDNRSRNDGYWWENPVEALNFNGVQHMTQALLMLKNQAVGIMKDHVGQGSSNPTSNGANNGDGSGPSGFGGVFGAP